MNNKISISRPPTETLSAMGVYDWPIWTCEVSEFPWEYSEEESCLILEGEIEVRTEEETAHIKPGDFVVFQKGLACTWIVSSPVKKHYSFS